MEDLSPFLFTKKLKKKLKPNLSFKNPHYSGEKSFQKKSQTADG